MGRLLRGENTMNEILQHIKKMTEEEWNYFLKSYKKNPDPAFYTLEDITKHWIASNSCDECLVPFFMRYNSNPCLICKNKKFQCFHEMVEMPTTIEKCKQCMGYNRCKEMFPKCFEEKVKGGKIK
jgi:hypothetical protein